MNNFFVLIVNNLQGYQVMEPHRRLQQMKHNFMYTVVNVISQQKSNHVMKQ